MTATMPSWVVGLRGQCVKQVAWVAQRDALVFHCNRDRRFVPVDHRTGARGTVNRRLRREVFDLPVWGRPVVLSIEYCQLKIGATDRRWGACRSSSPATGFTRRFGRFVSQLARHMRIADVAAYTGLVWRTVKAMDEHTLSCDLNGARGIRLFSPPAAKAQFDPGSTADLDAGHAGIALSRSILGNCAASDQKRKQAGVSATMRNGYGERPDGPIGSTGSQSQGTRPIQEI